VFCTVYEKTKKPLALIEIGTSAGLQLLWDQYSYSYGTNEIYGNRDSRLHLTSEIKGDNAPILHLTPPQVSTRIGIDLNTINLQNEDDKLWLTSLIWPEHKERISMFEEAASYVSEVPLKLMEGDGVTLLPNIINNISIDSVICIFHTHVANQMSLEIKKQLLQTVEEIGRNRDVFHIYNNIQ